MNYFTQQCWSIYGMNSALDFQCAEELEYLEKNWLVDWQDSCLVPVALIPKLWWKSVCLVAWRKHLIHLVFKMAKRRLVVHQAGIEIVGYNGAPLVLDWHITGCDAKIISWCECFIVNFKDRGSDKAFAASIDLITKYHVYLQLQNFFHKQMVAYVAR